MKKHISPVEINGITDKKIGKLIKDIRTLNSITQQEVACILNITYQQVQRYERGTNRLSVINLLKILNYIKITPEEFFKQLEKIK